MSRHPECTCSWSPCHHSNYGVQDALEADNKRLKAENERLGREAKNDLIAYKAAIERQNELRAEVAGLKTGYQAYERVNAELKAESERIERNRDMWKGQVARQAEELTSLRKDAERYRRIKLDASMDGSLIERLDCNIPVKLWDSAIDRELAK